ncbi:hypothetical protein [Neisseria animalis]|uniref:Periplasmic protein n=1 Tax=Neisseria animalis TaxID=492 RepID=A0A5P3MW43_NEIAN|nr:hypothetical protein [Neisseria animalis]QEY24879.1 hypothetical protein D0T90_10695 [Neisseria animalis]ROW32409.1 hypothetical protein CGZ60_04650 [Neisseria animalis]VEE08073.1 Uncharacterised protein [Neisseria animalis]
MNTSKFLALTAVAAGLAFSVNAHAAKEIKISSNATSYSDSDVQKLASTALNMGVKEPVSLARSGDSVTVSGSSPTKCTFKVGDGAAPQIQGVSCK